MPGQPIHQNTLMVLLRGAGIDLRGAKNASIREFVLQMPAPIVVDSFDYSYKVTGQHRRNAGAQFIDYFTKRMGCCCHPAGALTAVVRRSGPNDGSTRPVDDASSAINQVRDLGECRLPSPAPGAREALSHGPRRRTHTASFEYRRVSAAPIIAKWASVSPTAAWRNSSPSGAQIARTSTTVRLRSASSARPRQALARSKPSDRIFSKNRSLVDLYSSLAWNYEHNNP